jgi:hypothetical protein
MITRRAGCPDPAGRYRAARYRHRAAAAGRGLTAALLLLLLAAAAGSLARGRALDAAWSSIGVVILTLLWWVKTTLRPDDLPLTARERWRFRKLTLAARCRRPYRRPPEQHDRRN